MEETDIIAPPKKRRIFIKPRELVFGIILITICVIVSAVAINKIGLERDTTDARTISDRVIAAIAKRDGSAIRATGSPDFQKAYSATQLTQGFENVEIATLKTPTLDRQVIVNTPNGRSFYFVYKYSALKVPFYVRTTVQRESGHWYLTSIAGNIDESVLTSND
ncbi:MAG TPA: hypothetical protein VMB52_01015 [Verrucomicrobiae bacterium]|nr:hypothetical protein [Verrucomicrobiae bacterium]